VSRHENVRFSGFPFVTLENRFFDNVLNFGLQRLTLMDGRALVDTSIFMHGGHNHPEFEVSFFLDSLCRLGVEFWSDVGTGDDDEELLL